MAFVQVDYFSNALMMHVAYTAIIPDSYDTNKLPKTLYLLHGLYGNQYSWLTRSRVLELAEEKNIAIILPAGNNSFYVDNVSKGDLYGEYVGNELVQASRKLFHLSDKREDTFIAGLSMGGYGAIRNGLKYWKNFSHIAGLSAALVTYGIPTSVEETEFQFGRRSFYESVMGDLSQFVGSDKDPEALIKNLKQAGGTVPRMYLACGTEDELLPLNQRYRDFLWKERVELVYEEGPGAHDWKYWDSQIHKVMEWLPL